MSVTSTVHINFRGDARAALQFYHSVFGGELTLAPYGDVPAGQHPDQAEEIAWGQVEAPSGFRVMAYDVQRSLPFDPGANAFYQALRGDDTAELGGYWDALAVGATILVPMGPAVFSPLYGKLTDRFGVTWIIDLAAPPPA